MEGDATIILLAHVRLLLDLLNLIPTYLQLSSMQR